MKNKIKYLVVSVLLTCLLSTGGFAQENQKLAQTGFQFLSVVSDARAAAMADAVTSLQVGSSALFFNPAGMANMTDFIEISGSTNQWIADINHYTFGVAVSPADGNYGVFGLSLQYVDYGEFYGTRVAPGAPLGYVDTGIFKLSAMALGLGYAKQLTDQFSVGGQIRYVHQSLGDTYVPVNIHTDSTGTQIADTSLVNSELSPLVFDFGTQFKTGIKSLVFGMSVRNFSSEVKYANEGFQAPLVFTLGLSMNVMDLFESMPFEQSLYLSVDASHYSDHPEQIKVGLDYRLMNMFSIRGGYSSSNDENDFTFGLGVSKFGFSFDYCYTPFGVFDNVQRMTVRFSL
ncbi:MAG: PorV/PorQ family protein [bacterium]